MCFYLIGNYLSKQSFERMSWGYSWVFPTFVGCWKRLLEKYGFKRGLELWNKLLCSPFVVTRQVRLSKFLPAFMRSYEKTLPWVHYFEFQSFSNFIHDDRSEVGLNFNPKPNF
jgi:hypothetical protein